MPEVPTNRTRKAFQTLAATCHGRLVASAGRILNHPADAEDCVQDTLAAVWQRLESLHVKNLKAYVFRAVEFNALKRRARRVRHEPLQTDPAAPREPDDPDDQSDIDPYVLEEAVEGLPEAQQVVLRMKFYLGMTFREIGRTLSISNHTAASRARYALNVLRTVLRRNPNP